MTMKKKMMSLKRLDRQDEEQNAQQPLQRHRAEGHHLVDVLLPGARRPATRSRNLPSVARVRENQKARRKKVITSTAMATTVLLAKVATNMLPVQEPLQSAGSAPLRLVGALKRSRKQAQKKKTGGDLYYPDLSKWPPIVDLRDITKVSKKILEVCAEADTEGLFTAPVVEAFPEVADSYLSVVSEPMDFRTIEEERLPAYQDMHELQEDLIKVFRNCCVFNGEGTDYYHYAVNIWSGLNNIFKEACEEFDIAVPR